MIDLLAHLLVIGTAIALEPVQLVSFVAVLSSSRGLRAGWAFLAGWVGSLLSVAALTWLASAQLSDYASDVVHLRGVRRTIVVVEVALGVGLMLFAAWRVRTHFNTRHEPRLRVQAATLTVTHAALIGLLIPPWPLVIAGAVDVLRAEETLTRSVVAMLVFLGMSTSTLLAMQVWALRSPQSSMAHLGRLRAWLEPHAEHVISAIAALVGLWLMVRGLRRWY